MVTQRKENEWARKDAERKRREKQHQIQNEDNRVTHQKYISRIYAKSIIHGMRDQSFQVLEDQGLLRYDLPLTLRNSFIPFLLKYVKRDTNVNQTLGENITRITQQLQHELSDVHANVVQTEMNRRQQIHDDRQREAEHKEMEKRKRRERRRMLRIFYSKKALRGIT